MPKAEKGTIRGKEPRSPRRRTAVHCKALNYPYKLMYARVSPVFYPLRPAIIWKNTIVCRINLYLCRGIWY